MSSDKISIHAIAAFHEIFLAHQVLGSTDHKQDARKVNPLKFDRNLLFDSFYSRFMKCYRPVEDLVTLNTFYMYIQDHGVEICQALADWEYESAVDYINDMLDTVEDIIHLQDYRLMKMQRDGLDGLA